MLFNLNSYNLIFCFNYPSCISNISCTLWRSMICELSAFAVFLYLSKNETVFGNEKVFHMRCAFIFSIPLFLKLFSFEEKIQRVIINSSVIHVKCRILLSDFNQIQIFETDYREKNPIWNFTKFLSVGTESFHVGGRTDGRTCWHDAAKRRFSCPCLRAWNTLFEINLNKFECLPLWFIMAIVRAGITESSPVFCWEVSRFSEE